VEEEDGIVDSVEEAEGLVRVVCPEAVLAAPSQRTRMTGSKTFGLASIATAPTTLR
jgi:hypothetical protein